MKKSIKDPDRFLQLKSNTNETCIKSLLIKRNECDASFFIIKKYLMKPYMHTDYYQ